MKLDVFDGRFVGTFFSVDVDIANNVVETESSNGQIVISIVINLVHDIDELDDIIVADFFGTAHFEVKVDAASFITKSSLEKSSFVVTNGLIVGVELKYLTNDNLSSCARLELANVGRSWGESSSVSIVVVLLLLLRLISRVVLSVVLSVVFIVISIGVIVVSRSL